MSNNNLSQRKVESLIQKENSNKQLLVFLSEKFTYKSAEEWTEDIHTEKILVNTLKSTTDYLLQTGDSVVYLFEEKEEPQVDKNFSIIFEDEYILVINKPGNLPVHPAGRFYKNTLWFELFQKYGKIHIINRIDRETSGIVLIAKDKKSSGKLAKQFINGTVEKIYFAAVEGHLKESIQAQGILCKDENSVIRKKQTFILNGIGEEKQTCATTFIPETLSGTISLVKCIPKTGRFHQIRATLFSLGFPMIGDKIYGVDETAYIRFINGNLTEEDKQKLRIPRQALHAYSLSFLHPVTNEQLLFQAEIPKEIKVIL